MERKDGFLRAYQVLHETKPTHRPFGFAPAHASGGSVNFVRRPVGVRGAIDWQAEGRTVDKNAFHV